MRAPGQVAEPVGGEVAVVTAHTSSVEETRSLGEAVAGLVGAGEVVLLAGELGAGKTAFAQGFGRALGVREPIVSPTFTIDRQYQGRLPLHHLDVYRLEHLSEALDLGLAEVLDEGAVALIEWGDAITPVLGGDYLEIRITYGDADDDRRFEFVASGPRWVARARALREALAVWVSPADPSGEDATPC